MSTGLQTTSCLLALIQFTLSRIEVIVYEEREVYSYLCMVHVLLESQTKHSVFGGEVAAETYAELHIWGESSLASCPPAAPSCSEQKLHISLVSLPDLQ